MKQPSPRHPLERLVRTLLAHGLGLLASTQEVFALAGHFGWFMLVSIGLMEEMQQELLTQVGQRLLWLYELLGGVDETGHGGIGEWKEVWGKVSLVLYGVHLLLARVAGPGRPWRMRDKWALSTALAAGGYGVAFAVWGPRLTSLPDGGTWIPNLLGMLFITSLFSLWAFGFEAMLRPFQRALRGEPEETVPGGGPLRERRVLPILTIGAAVMALGFGVGLVRPGKASPPRPAEAPPAAGSSFDGGSPGAGGSPRLEGIPVR
ncbi:MAG TPA: hypothetical protein VFZ09_14415 [Archangium sp.]|uniref:hypothetical protein n=1 Tax=Archangium sp. TaxID=1872627 RepID=UPI002E32A6C4|nr:hypothetical protein [Archangium sp.]HEX5747435.1 hypothetical protein [Archangium sp.]